MEHSYAMTLQKSQSAPKYLEQHSTAYRVSSRNIFGGSESTELWNTYEQLLLSCLQTGDDKSARMCLERLSGRFGPSNERVMGLRGMYEEAIAANAQVLERILKEYESTLSKNPVNMPVAKRRIALLKNLSKREEAVKALVELLDLCPTDIEAWAELSELYCSMSMFPQAIFCLEETLLTTPNAWNVHARLGEILYMQSKLDISGSNSEESQFLLESLKRFCRSIELCDKYFRGYYGLKIVSDKLLAILSESEKKLSEISELSIGQLRALNERATSALKEMMEEHPNHLSKEETTAASRVIEQLF